MRKQQQIILEKQLRSLTNQYQQGFKTKSDFLRLKAQVQRAEMDRVTAENRIELSVAELDRLVGVGYRSPQPLVFDAIPVKQGQAIELLAPTEPPYFEKVYDFQISKIQGEMNSKSVTLAKRNYWPQVFLSSGISYSNLNYLNSNSPFSSNNQLSWNALVTLQFNFWDWGIRKRDVEIAQYNMDIQENGLNQMLLDSRAKINSMMADISRIRRGYKISQELLTLEDESYRNLEAQYREGKVTYLDLITGLNNLLDAKVQFYTSYFDALQATARYRYFEGTIYETLAKK